ncbi:DUF4197 domain-containing protein [Neolewinella lacunae]|uniref:DUF4197 domain-containing protein n=1 Tax=Neolewinella lacunae TaxID=1517758 RepID=A0A923TA01_9BACT|nr:DUF4197 domain-containing protein [Neolewinella lacunae]MBC6996056.1 DUF4197 domain-containing protein [Neolewinella lacunae]MDN3636824.1 DUF4197 domain-containing protein [Neolewinella lacunae]
MRKLTATLLLLLAALLFTLPAHAQFGKTLGKLKTQADEVLGGKGPLSEEAIGEGLKEALNQGVDKAVSSLSAVDGYLESPYKILLPEEAQSVVSRVSALPGFGNVEKDLTERINRAAELAATKAGPIFVDAIKGLTIKDAMNLLMGNQDAATRYLEGNTSAPLAAEFQPVIRTALDEVNANEIWNKVVTAYNKLPLVKKTNPELDAYVTQRALEGMFGLIEVKESELRQNPALRNTDLLKRVFARQDK